MFSLPVDQPHAADISMVRHRAGLTQTQAAKLIGLEGFKQWGRWERSLEPMPQALWELFLVKCGAHPHYMARPGVEVPRSAESLKYSTTMAEIDAQVQLTKRVMDGLMRATRKR